MTRLPRYLPGLLLSLFVLGLASCGSEEPTGPGGDEPGAATPDPAEKLPKLRAFSKMKKDDEGTAPRRLGPLGGGKEATNASAVSPEQRPAPVPSATDAGKLLVSGQVYRHPLGYRFRYPDGWQLKELDGEAIALVPPDVRRSQGGPDEIFLAGGTSAEGIAEPWDPRVITHAEQLMRQTFPSLQRDGEVAQGRHGGRPSVAIHWKGKSPAGPEYRACMWVTILKGAAFAFTVVCPEKSFETRQPLAEAIFASIHWEQPPVDPALVGHWKYEKTYISGSFSSVTVRYMKLLADGTALWSSRALFSMSHHDNTGDMTGSSSGDSGDSGVSRGRWSAANKKLYLVWDSGSEEEWGYYLEGSSMLLKPVNGGKNKLWKRSR